VVETLYFQAKEKSIKIIYLPQKELLYRGDRDMLSTIFRNLVSNSIKFSNLGGVINIDTRKRNNSIEISIKDSGIGMTPEEVNSLFKLNSQISTVGTSGEMGTGLGLILCHIFTKNHKGKILIDSEVDKGSRFTVVLPIQ
jgi:signal transduction histidine kinase